MIRTWSRMRNQSVHRITGLDRPAPAGRAHRLVSSWMREGISTYGSPGPIRPRAGRQRRRPHRMEAAELGAARTLQADRRMPRSRCTSPECRPRIATVQVDDSKCDLDLTGEPFAGVVNSSWREFRSGCGSLVEPIGCTWKVLRRRSPARSRGHGGARISRCNRRFRRSPAACGVHFSQAVSKLEVEWSE